MISAFGFLIQLIRWQDLINSTTVSSALISTLQYPSVFFFLQTSKHLEKSQWVLRRIFQAELNVDVVNKRKITPLQNYKTLMWTGCYAEKPQMWGLPCHHKQQTLSRLQIFTQCDRKQFSVGALLLPSRSHKVMIKVWQSVVLINDIFDRGLPTIANCQRDAQDGRTARAHTHPFTHADKETHQSPHHHPAGPICSQQGQGQCQLSVRAGVSCHWCSVPSSTYRWRCSAGETVYFLGRKWTSVCT